MRGESSGSRWVVGRTNLREGTEGGYGGDGVLLSLTNLCGNGTQCKWPLLTTIRE